MFKSPVNIIIIKILSSSVLPVLTGAANPQEEKPQRSVMEPHPLLLKPGWTSQPCTLTDQPRTRTPCLGQKMSWSTFRAPLLCEEVRLSLWSKPKNQICSTPSYLLILHTGSNLSAVPTAGFSHHFNLIWDRSCCTVLVTTWSWMFCTCASVRSSCLTDGWFMFYS